jgi:hypothetical protein
MTDERKPYSPEATCNKCGGEVLWASYTKRDGSTTRAMFDKGEAAHGPYCLMKRPDGRLYSVYVEKGGEWPPGSKRRQMHFKSCPGAK